MNKAVGKKPTKSELTRKKVIQAAIDSIYKEGFHAAHTNRIAETAGVSWGVLQYHFGDKDGLLQAVLDTIFDNYMATLSKVELSGGSLRERLTQLIDAVWGMVSGKEYRVSVAILRNAGKDGSSSINGQKQMVQWARRTSELWDHLLEQDVSEPVMSETARHLLFATLRGLADEINPRGKLTSRSWHAEREALSDAIAYLLIKK